jgi:hypothetical protein
MIDGGRLTIDGESRLENRKTKLESCESVYEF